MGGVMGGLDHPTPGPGGSMRAGDPTDLTGAEWAAVQPFLPPPSGSGAPRTGDFRSVLNTIFYPNRAGCPWRMLPNDLGTPWPTVYEYFARWKRDGTWDRLNAAPAPESGWPPGGPTRPRAPGASTASRWRGRNAHGTPGTTGGRG